MDGLDEGSGAGKPGAAIDGAAAAVLKARLRESELRLRELEHRFTNTLQLIAALLQLQAKQAHPEARRALAAAAQRVSALDVLYKDLMPDDEADTIVLSQRLGGFLALQQRIAPDNVVLSFASQGEDCIVPREVAINIMIVVNELVTNALKHAFPDGRAGKVKVMLSGMSGGHLVTVADDGIGTVTPRDAFGFGLHIAESLVEHLGGRIDFIPVNAGTRFDVRFAVPGGGSRP